MPGLHVATLDVACRIRRRPAFSAGPARAAQDAAALEALATRVLEELLAEPGDRIAALRGDRRFECAMKPGAAAVETAPEAGTGPVLITGGFGGIGLTLAQDFAARGAKLVLVARRRCRNGTDWDDHLRGTRRGPMARRIRAVRSWRRRAHRS